MAGEKAWLGHRDPPAHRRRRAALVVEPGAAPLFAGRPKPYAIPWLHAHAAHEPQPPRRRPARVHAIELHLIDFAKRYWTGRAQHRVFNSAVYRFYRSNSAPPEEGDTPFATSATLPSTPADTYADGTWWISVSYFNGVLDSGFLPLGANGETYLRLDLVSGAVVSSPPQAPVSAYLEVLAGGVVRVHALCVEVGALRPDTWAIAYTTDGSTPAEDSPDVTEAFSAGVGIAALVYDLPAASDGEVVKVRVQLERDASYSEGSTVLEATADAAGPSAPAGGESWPGGIPEA